MTNRQKGEAKNDFLIFLGLIFLLFILWVFAGGPKNFNPSGGLISNTNFVPRVPVSSSDDDLPVIDQYSPSEEFVILDNLTYLRSPWYGLVEISQGNARSTNEPREEYITLSASRQNREAIVITGWILENGTGKKLIYSSGSTFQGVSKRVLIPTGANLFGGATVESQGLIALNPGDKAVVTSGSFPQIGPIPIRASFRTNICTGYLDDLPNYNFTPSLKRDCPDPEASLNGVVLEDKCLDYISRLSRCHTPDTEPFRERSSDGSTFTNSSHLDKISGFSPPCRSFVLRHYNYRSCWANHLLSKDFYGNEWRVFLNQPFELWGKDREIITLYDSQGRLVDQLKY